MHEYMFVYHIYIYSYIYVEIHIDMYMYAYIHLVRGHWPCDLVIGWPCPVACPVFVGFAGT